MPKRAAIIFSLTLLGMAGCDADRISKLEKENADLKAKLEKQDTTRNYDFQAKCSKDARVWFNENWSRDKDTILLDFSNHYNIKQNKCFIFVWCHQNSHASSGDLASWSNQMTLFDVYENAKYAEFLQDHVMRGKPDFKWDEPVLICDLQGTTCKSIDEFYNFLHPFMND